MASLTLSIHSNSICLWQSELLCVERVKNINPSFPAEKRVRRHLDIDNDRINYRRMFYYFLSKGRQETDHG